MNKRLLIAPFEKEGTLTLEEVRCPICWSVFIEPVTLPCKHSVCLECFKKHIQEAALCCPCCRERISVWSRRAMKANNLVNVAFWERLKKELPMFVQARLDGQDSQDVLASLTFDDCDESANFNNDNDANCGTTAVENYKIIDGEITTAGEIRKEFESIHKQHLDDLENRRKREAQASAEFIRKLKEEEQGIRLLAAAQQSSTSSNSSSTTIAESEEKSANVNASKSHVVQPRQSRKLARNLLSEWSGADLSLFDKSTSDTNETQSLDEPTCEEKTKKSFKGETSSTLTTKIVKSTHPLNNKFTTTRKVVQVAPFNSAQPSTSRSNEGTSSSFVQVHGPQAMPYLENFGQDDNNAAPHSTVKFSINQHKENFPKSSSTPDSINIELNSHFRPIRTAPKTPPKRLPDGSYLPEPRLVKSTPLRPRSISEDDSPQPGLTRVDKLIRTADSEMNNGFVCSLPSVTGTESVPSPSSQYPEVSIKERPHKEDIGSVQVEQQQEQSDDSQRAEEPTTTTSDWPAAVTSPPNSNSDGEEESADKAERDYYLMQALQLEQFRLKKLQEDEDRKYAEMIHKTINKDVHPLARSRESSDRYSIRNWVSHDRQTESSTSVNPLVLADTHTRNRKRTALSLCTSVNDATSSASNSLRRSTRLSTATKSKLVVPSGSTHGGRKRGRPRKSST